MRIRNSTTGGWFISTKRSTKEEQGGADGNQVASNPEPSPDKDSSEALDLQESEPDAIICLSQSLIRRLRVHLAGPRAAGPDRILAGETLMFGAGTSFSKPVARRSDLVDTRSPQTFMTPRTSRSGKYEGLKIGRAIRSGSFKDMVGIKPQPVPAQEAGLEDPDRNRACGHKLINQLPSWA